MKKYMAERKKDPNFAKELKRKQNIYYKKRREKLEKDPELLRLHREKNNEKSKRFRERLKKNPKKYKEWLIYKNEANKKSLSKMPEEKKKAMLMRGREKWKKSERRKALLKFYKDSGIKEKKNKEWWQKVKNDPEYRQKEKIRHAEYRKQNKEKIRLTENRYILNRRKIDPLFKLAMNMRARMRIFITKSGFNKKKSTFKLIGCSPENLRKHLEKKFKNGMTWKNHGEWHIDHIKPLSSAKNVDQMNKLFHYSNLQPLWATENLKKSNKY